MRTEKRLLIIAGLLILGCTVYAQTEETKPATSSTLEKPIKQETVFKPSYIEIPAGTLETAIRHLEKAWVEYDKKRPINIVINKDAREIEIDSLKLRNVRYPQAFMIIVSAAGCRVDEIYYPYKSRSPDSRPVGYIITPVPDARQKEKLANLERKLEALLDDQMNEKSQKPKIITHTIPLQTLEPNKDLDSLIETIIVINGWNTTDINVAVHKPLGILIIRGPEYACKILDHAIRDARDQHKFMRIKNTKAEQSDTNE